MIHALLIEDGRTRGTLPAARALAGVGIRVGLGCPDRSGLAYWSNTTVAWDPVPPVANGVEPFIDAVARAVRRQGADVVFPAGDAEALALTYGRDRIPAVVPLPSFDTVRRAIDKLDLCDAAGRGGLAAPRTVLPTADNLASFGSEAVVVKARLHWSPETTGRVSRIEASLCHGPAEVRAAVARITADGGEPVLQEVVSGGAPLNVHTVTDHDGAVLCLVACSGPARFYPPGAGRRTRAQVVPIAQDFERAIAATLREMSWVGFGSLAFLVEDSGRPLFVDFNGRIPMSLDSTVRAAGVNVMELWANVGLRTAQPSIPTQRLGERHQWLAGDVKRAFSERRGGLRADLVETLRYAVGAHHTTLVRGDMAPLLRQTVRSLTQRKGLDR